MDLPARRDIGNVGEVGMSRLGESHSVAGLRLVLCSRNLPCIHICN